MPKRNGNNTKRTTEVLTLRQAAHLLHCHTTTLYRLCRSDEIPHFRLGSDYRFVREILDGWMMRGGTWRAE